MTRHLTHEELRRFQRNANPQQLLRADRHLAGCEECRRILQSFTARPSLPVAVLEEASVDVPLHPEYEQLCAYLDGGQNPEQREWMENHLLVCASCATEVKDLQGFDSRLVLEQAQQANRPIAVKREPKPAWMAQWVAPIRTWLQTPGNARFAWSSMALVAVGIAVMAQVQISHPQELASHIDGAIQASSGDVTQFYFGLVVAGLGLAGLVHRLRK